MPGRAAAAAVQAFRQAATRSTIINGEVLEVPNGILKQFERLPEVFRVHYDRPTSGFNYRTSVTVGAATVRSTYGYNGAGVGVAVIDSGVANWHDDLSGTSNVAPLSVRQPARRQVRRFRERPARCRTTTTATAPTSPGIIGGNGYDSNGEKAGIAPKASLISLKVLERERRRHDQQHHRGAGLGGPEPPDLQHPRRQHVGRRADHGVVLDRPADGRRQAR